MDDSSNPVSQVRRLKEGDLVYDALAFCCPGCKEMFPETPGFHLLPVNTTQKSPSWDWNGSVDAPTLSPSISSQYSTGDPPDRCHSFLRDGFFEFLGDCTHSMAGQRVPMIPLEDWLLKR